MGMPENRHYHVELHRAHPPQSISVGENELENTAWEYMPEKHLLRVKIYNAQEMHKAVDLVVLW